MILQQMSIFDDVVERYKIDKPIRLIEFFAGIGAQAKALEILGVPFEHYKTCEWAYNSYCAYNAIHIKDKKNYAEGLSKEELIEKVNGTSVNYNEPLTNAQLQKKNIEWLRNAYNNIIATHNLINIMNVKGKDLEIVDKDKYDYVLTYSFPCQDLSLAGKRKGMSVSQAEGGTRSGLLWEVERILGECYELNCLPQILIMENVPEVCGKGNARDFEKWQMRLSEFGYSNYCEILNAKDYGIPQNRRRCFMVSILGDYNYTFPKKTQLRYRLKDLLEKNVDPKYFLSEKMINFFTANTKKQQENGNGFKFEASDGDKVAKAVTTRAGGRMDDNFVYDIELKRLGGLYDTEEETHQAGSIYDKEGLSPTLDCSNGGGHRQPIIVDKVVTLGNCGNGHHSKDVSSVEGVMPTLTTGNHNNGQVIAIKNATSKGYDLAEEGDGIDISSRMQYHRGTVQKGSCQTLTTQGGGVGVVMPNLQIRKLTPCECLKLMGFSEGDYEALREINMADGSLYHVAGDSIVSTVLVGIFSNLVNELNSHEHIINNYVDKEIL